MKEQFLSGRLTDPDFDIEAPLWSDEPLDAEWYATPICAQKDADWCGGEIIPAIGEQRCALAIGGIGGYVIRRNHTD